MLHHVIIISQMFLNFFRLGGYAPFSDPDPVKLNRLIKSGQYEFHSPEWDEVSNVTKVTPSLFTLSLQPQDFISKLLLADPSKRMTITEALEHPFITDDYKQLSDKINQGLADRFAKFNAARKFKVSLF
jgi:serine/threonine protein kinase